jgi:hypothetical protein
LQQHSVSSAALSISVRIQAHTIEHDTAEHAHAADRFAREIVAILARSLAARSRRLMRNSLGGNLSVSFWLQIWQSVSSSDRIKKPDNINQECAECGIVINKKSSQNFRL